MRRGRLQYKQPLKYGESILYLTPVGASLLAMDVNEDVYLLVGCGVLTFFASKLAPTKGGVKKRSRPCLRRRWCWWRRCCMRRGIP
ncbi:Inner membrane protein [Pseudomonas sp. IT-P74]